MLKAGHQIGLSVHWYAAKSIDAKTCS